MKRSRFQKWFWKREFPAIAAQRSRVEQDGDEIQFTLRRIARQQQSRPHFCRQSEIHQPDFTGVDDWHLRPPFGRISSRLPKRPGRTVQSLHFPPPIRTTCDAPPAVRPQSTLAMRSRFQSHSCEESTGKARCWQAPHSRPVWMTPEISTSSPTFSARILSSVNGKVNLVMKNS